MPFVYLKSNTVATMGNLMKQIWFKFLVLFSLMSWCILSKSLKIILSKCESEFAKVLR